MLEKLIMQNRSRRRFFQEEVIGDEILTELVNLARLSASAANLQPLKYFISNGRETNAQIFSCLSWAAYLNDWPGPDEGERPSAYIIILGDTHISKHFGCDHGIAAQSILLGAVEKGFGGCMVGAIDRPKLQQILEIEERYTVILAIALGKPKEEVIIEEVAENGDIKYWHDEKDTHHVPKRSLEEIIIRFKKE
ncbi:MAG: nitroreductase family protein [Thermodesulfobacteriota bacterium]|nr:nitroreductase family protein [Thermodesulfobacteriota bacterium]